MAVFQNVRQYCTTTARIAPSWITTLNCAHCADIIAEQFGSEDQVPGRGDRHEFGQSLDDAEQDRGEGQVPSWLA